MECLIIKLEVWLVSHFKMHMLQLVKHPFIYPLEVLYVYLSDITHKLMNEVPGERFTAALFNL